MHQAALQGFSRNLQAIPADDRAQIRRVIDLGGQDVNGTVHREVLRGGDITLDVLDIRAGAGVTIVGDARNTDWWDGQPYDLVISTEMLEHLQHWEAAVEVVGFILRPGGWFIGTCASIGRRPHGANGEYDPPAGEYYRNVEPTDLVLAAVVKGFDHIEVQYSRDPSTPHGVGDLYWRARKA